MHMTCKAAQVTNKMCRYNITVLGTCESRWSETWDKNVAFSGHTYVEDEQHVHKKDRWVAGWVGR